METLAAGQRWTYRVPDGFELSRIVVGAILRFEKADNIVCCSIFGAPSDHESTPDEITTIPFLPMTEPAFRASVLALDGLGEVAAGFAKRFLQWGEDPKGLAAFSVPFGGSLDRMIELQFGRRERAGDDREVGSTLLEIGNMLAGGLKTQVEPFPRTEREFEQILNDLRQLDKNDHEAKLVIGGFLNHPYGPDQQRCLECIYYLPHRLWCDLPEIALPVEPHWWCRLWRV